MCIRDSGKIYVNVVQNVASVVRVYSTSGKLVHTLDFSAPGTVQDLRGRWTGGEAFFAYSSFAVPTTVYRVGSSGAERTVWWKPGVSIDADAIEVRQVWYPSKDGTKIPMFIMHKKGLKPDGNSPTLLTGYGGFTVSETPTYKGQSVLWAERGVHGLGGGRVLSLIHI